MGGMNAGLQGQLLLGEIGLAAVLPNAVRAVNGHRRGVSGGIPDLSSAAPDFHRASSPAVVEGLGDPRTLAAKLRAERERQELTVQWVADKIGISKQSVSAFEKGQEPPGEDVIAKWISALRLPATWALDWADWRRAEKMITAGQIRFRNEGQRERMHMTLYEMLRGGRQ